MTHDEEVLEGRSGDGGVPFFYRDGLTTQGAWGRGWELKGQGQEAAAGGGALGDVVSSALPPSWGEKHSPQASSQFTPLLLPNLGDIQ